jgi:hypothetical protein
MRPANINVLETPLSSIVRDLDLNPCNFYLLLSWKSHVKRMLVCVDAAGIFDDTPDVRECQIDHEILSSFTIESEGFIHTEEYVDMKKAVCTSNRLLVQAKWHMTRDPAVAHTRV